MNRNESELDSNKLGPDLRDYFAAARFQLSAVRKLYVRTVRAFVRGLRLSFKTNFIKVAKINKTAFSKFWQKSDLAHKFCITFTIFRKITWAMFTRWKGI